MSNSKLTASNAIEQLEEAIKTKNRPLIVHILAHENSDNLPEWDDEPDHIFNEWEALVEKGLEVIEPKY